MIAFPEPDHVAVGDQSPRTRVARRLTAGLCLLHFVHLASASGCGVVGKTPADTSADDKGQEDSGADDDDSSADGATPGGELEGNWEGDDGQGDDEDNADEANDGDEGNDDGADEAGVRFDIGFPDETDDGSSETEDCPDVQVDFIPVVPTVVLLIDQSQSMLNHLDNSDPTSPLRWPALEEALFDPTTGAVAALEDRVRFGMALYTATDQGNQNGEICPMLVEVEPSLNNFMAMRDTFAGQVPLHNTPTPDSLEAMTTQLQNDPDDGPKYIILATDGDPDTCEQPNPNQGHDEAIAAAGAAHAAGFTTFIISVGPELSQAHLQAMADAGAGQPDSPFFEANDQAGLTNAFADILDIVRDCIFTLDGMIAPGFESKGTVLVNGVELPFDDPDGWQVLDPTRIELLGEACESIQSGTVNVDISFPCDGIIPPN